MLTLPEKIFFILAFMASIGSTIFVSRRIIHTIQRGQGKPDLKLALDRLASQVPRLVVLQPTFNIRFLTSVFHALIAWGFLYFLLVNMGDILQGLIPGLTFLDEGLLGGIYRFGADMLSVAVLVGMTALIIRRWLIRPPELNARQDILLQPSARSGIARDSIIVAAFILVHVGSRLLAQAVQLALEGNDPWQPFASALASLFKGMDPSSLILLEHIFFWGSVGTILAFIPYFLISKHLHLIMAPLNFLLKPKRRSIGELSKLDFDDPSLEKFGAERLEDLGWEQIMDAYACIMCYRCQQVCPAYQTGKILSPAALEINKRYLLNKEGSRLARGEPSSQTLVAFAIPEEAIWACTACGACVDICPVNNEPMRDILNIRQSLVLMENRFPKQLQQAFRGMERNANPWNIPGRERLGWTEGLQVPSIEENPEPEILWWVGCAPATDARAQRTARAFTKILKAGGINFAVLGENEQCTGDAARRAGKEDIFFALATANIEILNEIQPARIVTTCPHCLHTLKNEYPAFGGNYTVIHHSQLIQELIQSNRLKIKAGLSELNKEQADSSLSTRSVAFHDPCYLGRQNKVLHPPREILRAAGQPVLELPRHASQSFCCGAGGAQMWKEEEHGNQRINANRFQEAVQSGVNTLAVACPFCLLMLTDAGKDSAIPLEVMDIAEIVADQLE
jgi:Fe-S oxidoreductase